MLVDETVIGTAVQRVAATAVNLAVMLAVVLAAAKADLKDTVWVALKAVMMDHGQVGWKDSVKADVLAN